MTIFKFRNKCNKQLEWKKRWKNGVACLVPVFSSWIMVLKLSKKLHVLKFCADFSKKSNSIKAIHIYASETSCSALSENGMVYFDMTYCFGGIRVWCQRILLNFCWVSISDTLIANISWTVAQTPINHIMFWISVMRTFWCIYLNCFHRFLAEVSTNLAKMHFFGQFKDSNLESKHEN